MREDHEGGQPDQDDRHPVAVQEQVPGLHQGDDAEHHHPLGDGLEPARVTRIFFVQGAVIGAVGTLVGVVLGLALAFNVHVIVPWLEGTFGFRIMPGDVFYVTEIPSEVHLVDVVSVPLLAFAISMAATLYPSRRAARVAPARALRYE